MLMIKRYCKIVKLETILIIQGNSDAAHSICNLKYSITKENKIFFTMDLTMIFILS